MASDTPPKAAMTPKQPKQMSSQLLTLKFMQRAVASSATDDASEEPSAKRRRLSEKDAVAAALQDREDKRRSGLEKHLTQLGDTRWTVNNAEELLKPRSRQPAKQPLSVAYVGFEQIDGPSQPGEGSLLVEDGHMWTPNFKRRKHKVLNDGSGAADDDAPTTSPDTKNLSHASRSKTKGKSKDKSTGRGKDSRRNAPISISMAGSRPR